ncbi:MAG: GAF domain-containing protein [Armatimonadetes bacterium]|nr:GAF domain-containing protein [Armatimonadota bacterium]
MDLHDRRSSLIETLVRAKNWKEMAQAIAEHLKDILPYDRLSCLLVYPEEQVAEIVVPFGEVEGLARSGDRLPLEGTATGWVVQHKRPLLETEGQEFTPTFAEFKAKGFQTRLAIPIEAGGEIIASLVFYKVEPNAYSESDIERIQFVLPILSALIQRMKEQIQLEQALEREKWTRRKFEILLRLDALLISGEPMQKILQSLAELLYPFIPFDRFSISVYDESTNREWLYVIWQDGPFWEVQRSKPFIRFGIAKEVMKTGKPVIRLQLEPEKFPAEKWLIEQGFQSALVYPLKMRERFKATFNFSSRQKEKFNQSHIAFLDELVEPLSIAFGSLLQEREEENFARLREGLLQLSMDLLSVRSVNEIFDAVNKRLPMFELENFSFIVRFPDGIFREVFASPEGIDFKEMDWLPQPIKEGETILGDILLGKREIFVSNDPVNEVSEIERQNWLKILKGEVYKFGNAVVPTRGHSGILGAICLDFRETRRFFSTQDELLKIIQTIGNLVGIALESIWLEEKLQRQLKETQVLHRLILEAASGSDWKQIAQSLVEKLAMVLPCHEASVLLLSEDKKHLDFAAVYPSLAPGFTPDFRLPINVGIIGYAIRTGEPVLERDVRTNPYYFAARKETLSELCVPIRIGNEIVGAINLESPKLAAFDESHLAFMQTLAAQLGTVMERSQILRRQTELAQQLSVIFEGILEGIALISTDGRLEDVNKKFGDLVGLPSEELRNQNVSLLVNILLRRAADPVEMKEILSASLSNPVQPIYDTLTLKSPERLLERYCVPIWLPDGTLFGQLWVLRDVTEERQRQHEILRLERLKTLGELASGIAHDLNNALSPALGGADILRQMTEGEIQTIAETIYHSLQHATDIIRRLQDFYKTTAIGFQTTVDVHQLLQDAISITRSYWRESALAEGVTIRVETHFADEPAITKGIPAELRQIFINIIMNAADAIVEKAKLTGKREGLISIVTECKPDQIVIHVVDDGIGMTEEVQRRAFEVFFTTKGDRGAGLGLSTAFATVSIHGGSITLRSQPMEGTTATVSLPLVQPSPVVSVSKPFMGAEFPRWKVLIVDDHYLVLQTITAQLQRLGLETKTARHGGEAWEILQQERFDFVVADFSMPVMNGIELARKIRERFPKLPVIILTGWGEFVPHKEIQALDIFTVLSKPITLQAWRETLSSLMERTTGTY